MISGAARVAPEKAVFRPALPMSFLPGISEMHMSTMTYKEQYLHPSWQRKRLEVMQQANFRCEVCGEDGITLNVHHRRYVKGRKVWEYENHDLQCLCESCHAEHHDNRALLDLLLMHPEASLAMAIGLLAGHLHGAVELSEEIRADAERVGGAAFEVGVLSSMVGVYPDRWLAVSKAFDKDHLTGPQAAAISSWESFAKNLKDSGL